MTNIQKFITELGENELNLVLEQLGNEYKDRIIAIFNALNVTSYTFDCPSDECPLVCVEKDHWEYIPITVIGLDHGMINKTVLNTTLYVVDMDNVMYWGDSIDFSSLGDVYDILRNI